MLFTCTSPVSCKYEEPDRKMSLKHKAMQLQHYILTKSKSHLHTSQSLIPHLGTTGQGPGLAALWMWGAWCCGGAQCGGSARASGRSARAELRLHPGRSHAPRPLRTGLFQKTRRRSCPQSQGQECCCTEVYQGESERRQQDTWGTLVAWGVKHGYSSHKLYDGVCHPGILTCHFKSITYDKCNRFIRT